MVNEKDAAARGRRDAERGRAPIFRSTRAYGIVAEVDDSLADDWGPDARRAYLDGYDGGRAHAHQIVRGACSCGWTLAPAVRVDRSR